MTRNTRAIPIGSVAGGSRIVAIPCRPLAVSAFTDDVLVYANCGNQVPATCGRKARSVRTTIVQVIRQ